MSVVQITDGDIDHKGLDGLYAETVDFNEYQRFTDTVAVYPEAGRGTPGAVVYATLGVANEAGELAGKLKKAIRGDGNDDADNTSILDRVGSIRGSDSLKKELGDVLYYVARVARENGWSLAEVANDNRKNLQDRKERGVLKGSGDNR